MMNLLSSSIAAGGGKLLLALPPARPIPSPLTSILLQIAPRNLPPALEAVWPLIQALAILLIGWLVAILAATLVRGILNRTQLDNKVAGWFTGSSEESSPFPIEKWAATAVFWVVMVFVLIGCLKALDLTDVSAPLQGFLDRIFSYLPQIGAAILWIFVAWLVANAVKLAVKRAAQTFGLDQKFQDSMGSSAASGTRVDPATPMTPSPTATATTTPPVVLSETIGNALYWFVLLFFLPIILETLGLQEQLVPVQNLLNDILLALPKILKAVLIGAVGWFIARIVRGIVTNLLAAAGADRVGRQIGLNPARGTQSLSWLAGTVVYVLILIPTVVASLDALEISAVSDPAISMLNQVTDFLPQLAVAAIILTISFYTGRFVADLVTQLLTGIGFNNLFTWLGLENLSPTISAPSGATSAAGTSDLGTPEGPASSTKTPSEIVGILVLVGLMLFALVTATDILQLDALTEIVNGIIAISGPVLVAVVILAVGLYLANLAFRLITSSGNRQARILAHAARISIITLTTAMALDRMGLAPSIINLAFGLLVGGIAVAIALAFGLGGREVAAEQLREWMKNFREG